MQRSCGLIILIFTLNCFSKQLSVKINVFGVDNSGFCYLYEGYSDKAIDSISSSSGTYLFSISNPPSFYRIIYGHNSSELYMPYGYIISCYFPLDSFDITCFLNVSRWGNNSLVISDSPLLEEYQKVSHEILSNKKIGMSTSSENELLKELLNCVSEINSKIFEYEALYTMKYIKSHPNSLISLDLLIMHGNRFKYLNIEGKDGKKIYFQLCDILIDSFKDHAMINQLKLIMETY